MPIASQSGPTANNERSGCSGPIAHAPIAALRLTIKADCVSTKSVCLSVRPSYKITRSLLKSHQICVYRRKGLAQRYTALKISCKYGPALTNATDFCI
jgi:hypothetical protein